MNSNVSDIVIELQFTVLQLITKEIAPSEPIYRVNQHLQRTIMIKCIEIIVINCIGEK